MHLVFDTRWIFEHLSGIGVHTRELVRHFPEALAPEDRVTLLFENITLRDRLAHETGHPFEHAIVPFGPNSAANQTKLFGALRALNADVYHSTNYMVPLFGAKPLRVVSTVHDLIPIMVPNYAPRSKKSKIPFLFPMVLKRCIRRSDAVVAVSESTRRDILTTSQVDPEKVTVIPNGVLDRFKPSSPSPSPRTTTPQTILYVGRRDPYKNLPLLIDAFARLHRDMPELRLLIIGPDDPRYPEAAERVKSLSLADAVTFQGQVDDEALIRAYQDAALLAFPSAYEGFGLPVLEAMACGTPVVCSNTSSLPEVAGDAALLVPPEVESFVAAMKRALTDSVLRNQLIEKGLRQSATFSWRATAASHAKLYRQIL